MAQQSDAPAPAEILTRDELRFLVEIGFLACRSHNVNAARSIFEGLRILRPQRPFPYIGLAMASMSAGEPDEAARILRDEGLRANPDDDDIQVFLGLALSEAKRHAESRGV